MSANESKHADAALAELGQLEWLRALARSLTADVQAGEDAVQETAISALKAGEKKRGWLVRVLTNRLRQDRRSAVRRSDREALWAGDTKRRQPETREGPAEIAARLDVHHLLLSAVRSLEEPYQTAIALRFLEGLSAREVATRQGLPLKTVRTHIDRGLARLRERLDRTAGGRDVWLSALAPLALPPSPPPAPWMEWSRPLVGTIAASLLLLAAWRLIASPANSTEHEMVTPPSQAEEPDQAPTEPLVSPDDLHLPEDAPRFPVDPLLPLADAGSDERDAVEPMLDARSGELELIVEAATSSVRFEDLWLTVSGDEGSEFALPRLDPFEGVGRRTSRVVSVPAGIALSVAVDGVNGVRATEVSVPALRPMERRTVHVRVSQGVDRIFYGRVTAAESGAPLAGALARRVDSRRAKLPAAFEVTLDSETDADGLFELSFPSWEPGTLLVRHRGRGFVELALDRVESSPEAPLEIALQEEGTLAVQLTTRWPVWEGELVASWARGGGSRASFDHGGKALLSGLPAGHRVALELWRDGVRVARHPDSVTLDGGASPSLTWNLAGGLRVSGTLADGEGLPLPEHEVWAIGIDAGANERWTHRLFEADDVARVALRASTDVEGRYTLDGLGAGLWWIGSAPDERCSHAAWAQRIEVASTESPPFERVVDLVAEEALFISGTLTGRKGRPFRWAQLTASPLRDAGGRSVARVEEDGNFRVGPLAPGRYLLFASGAGFMSQGRTVAEAGDVEVELNLGHKNALGGRVVDENGQSTAAHVSLIRAEGGSLGMGTNPRQDGFLFGLLSPGTYALRASSPEGGVAILGPIELQDGEALLDHELRLSPAARLSIEYDGPDGLRCAIFQSGVRVEDASLRGDTFLPLPPGPIEVVLYGSIDGEYAELRRRPVLLDAGRLHTLELTVHADELSR